MSKSLTEQKVLKKLDIVDFRHLTKDKVITMATMLDKMDPEVAKKAIEQFPNFSSTMKDVFAEYKKLLDKAMETNEKSVMSFYSTCDETIASCQKQLEKDELSFEEKKQILDTMLLIINIKGDKDSEEKKFIISMCAIGVAALTITVGALSSVLGGNTKIDLSNIGKHIK